MKVLFVFSGNSNVFSIAPFIKSQGDSLVKKGIIVDYYPIKGKGIRGYLSNRQPLKKKIKKNKYDIIHTHYSLAAALTLLTFSKTPIVASYMGDDAYGSYNNKGKVEPSSYWLIILSFIIQPFLSYIICKSPNIKKRVFVRKSTIIPNGVDTSIFMENETDNNQADHPNKIKKILFLGDKNSTRKNYKLLEDAVKLIDDWDCEIITPYPVAHSELPRFYNEADVLALPSIEEGSPNVIKEAMACNCPIVSTDVGDVKWLLGKLDGHYLSSFDAVDFSNKLKQVFMFGKRTCGRTRIYELGLDSDHIADRIISIYNMVISNSSN